MLPPPVISWRGQGQFQSNAQCYFLQVIIIYVAKLIRRNRTAH